MSEDWDESEKGMKCIIKPFLFYLFIFAIELKKTGVFSILILSIIQGDAYNELWGEPLHRSLPYAMQKCVSWCNLSQNINNADKIKI